MGTLMFSDVITRLHVDASLSKVRRRDLISAVNRGAKILQRSPETIPADPRWLRPRFENLVPAGIGLTPKSWSNLRSDLKAALAQVGITKRSINRREDLSPAWSALWSTVLASGDMTVRISLSAFVYFLNGQGVSPEDVRNDHALAFRDALALNEISRAPDTTLSNAVGAWNLATGRIPGWPTKQLSSPPRQKLVKVPLEGLQPSLQKDLDRYMTSLAAPDPFDTAGRVAPLRPATINAYRERIERFIGALVRSGLPREELSGLADLVIPARVEKGLRWMLAKNEGETSVSIAQTAQLMCSIARSHAHLEESDEARLAELTRKVAVRPQIGMTAKNRERLRPFQDKDTRRKLLTLPEHLFGEASQMPEGPKAARLMERAVAIAILLYAPIRVKNLAAIHLEENLQRFGNGRVYLTFEAGEIKNRYPMEVELPMRVVGLIDRHLAARNRWLCGPKNQWLFPRRKGRLSMNSGQLSEAVFKTIHSKTGLKMNVHLFRHFAAMMYLEARPGEYEAVRRLLGHKSLSMTLNAYAGFEAGTATRLFSEIIDAEREG
ncbi:MAG: tyrosine-type recombinase/integrase [Parasphingorhabdus sp.]